jgi:3-oxoacyl-[acyl-carrier-protein] synthase III
MIIPQNINKSGWNYYCQVLNYPIENVFLDNCNDGHMGDVDIIRNITDVNKYKKLESGKYALVYGLGTGLSWNALLIRAN